MDQRQLKERIAALDSERHVLWQQLKQLQRLGIEAKAKEEREARALRDQRRAELGDAIDALDPKARTVFMADLLTSVGATQDEQRRYASRAAAARLRSLGYERTRVRVGHLKPAAWVR